MKKVSLILLFMVFGFVLSVLPVYAFDCGLTTPANSGTLGTLGLINFSFSDIGLTEASVTCYLNATSSSTANSTRATFVTSASNETKATNMPLNIVNMTFPNSAILEDASDYTFYGSCQNSTARITCNATRTNVIVDRTTPSAPTSITTAKRDDGDTITATVTGTDTTRCTLAFGLGGIRNTMVHSGNTCTYTVSKDNPSDGIYQFKVYATDQKDETASLTTTIEIDAIDNPARRSPSSLQMSQPVANAVSSGGGGNMQTILKVGLVLVALDLILGLGFVFKKK